jgi:hypothetical protein
VAESYQNKKQMSEEHFRAAATQRPEETTPSAITEPIKAFAATLGSEGPRYVPVAADPLGLYGWCSDGVLERMKESGGSIRFGWIIWEWPGVLLTGEFHAVWVDPAGQLIDITPKPHAETRIVFVPDQSYFENFDFDDRPLNRRWRLYEPADPSAEIAEHIARMKPAQRAYEKKRAAKAHVTLEQSLWNKRPPDPFATLVDDLIRVCDEFDSVMDASQATGYVEVSPKMQSLQTEKMRLLQQIKRSRG